MRFSYASKRKHDCVSHWSQTTMTIHYFRLDRIIHGRVRPRLGLTRGSLSGPSPVKVRLGNARLRKELEVPMYLRTSPSRGWIEDCSEQSVRQQPMSNPADEMDPTTPIQQPRKRPRLPGGRTACTRCKTRKQKYVKDSIAITRRKHRVHHL